MLKTRARRAELLDRRNCMNSVKPMPAVLLDANAYIMMGRARFDALVELERTRQVTRYAEPMALTELLAHLVDPTDPSEFRSCRAAVVRMFQRCAGEGPCGIIRDSESRCAEVLTGKGLNENDEHTNQLRFLLMHVGHDFPLSMIEPQLRTIKAHVAAMEAQWADTMRELQRKVPLRPGETQKKDPMRVRITESSRVASANMLVRFASEATGKPVVLPDRALAAARRVAAPWIEFGARIYDKVVFDRVNVESPAIRNLLWDQWLAFNIGQTIGPRTLWLVTDDVAFKDAAEATGYGDRVLTLGAYERWLTNDQTTG
jgi:hypothetical protein